MWRCVWWLCTIDFCLYFSLVFFVCLFHFADMLKSLISNWLFCPLVLSFSCRYYFGVASPSVSNTWLWSEAVHSVEVCSSSRAVFSLLILPLLLEHKVDVFSFRFLAPFFFFFFWCSQLAWGECAGCSHVVHWRLLPFPALALPRCLFLLFFSFFVMLYRLKLLMQWAGNHKMVYQHIVL